MKTRHLDRQRGKKRVSLGDCRKKKKTRRKKKAFAIELNLISLDLISNLSYFNLSGFLQGRVENGMADAKTTHAYVIGPSSIGLPE